MIGPARFERKTIGITCDETVHKSARDVLGRFDLHVAAFPWIQSLTAHQKPMFVFVEMRGTIASRDTGEPMLLRNSVALGVETFADSQYVQSRLRSFLQNCVMHELDEALFWGAPGPRPPNGGKPRRGNLVRDTICWHTCATCGEAIPSGSDAWAEGIPKERLWHADCSDPPPVEVA